MTWAQVLGAIVVFIVTLAASLLVVTFVLVKLPATYFHTSHDRTFLAGKNKAVRWSGLLLKNVAGGLLVILGVLMSLPGVPGQGLLTILLGLMLLDFPGKQKLEIRIVGHPKVRASIDKLRARFGKPPLVLNE